MTTDKNSFDNEKSVRICFFCVDPCAFFSFGFAELGVLSMAYGFYQNSQAALYAGSVVTLLGALDGIIFLAIQPGELRLRRQRE
jgi:hypothetical protein